MGVSDILGKEEEIMASKGVEKAKRLLGLTDDQIRDAIRQARREAMATGTITGEAAGTGSPRLRPCASDSSLPLGREVPRAGKPITWVAGAF
jgi:hypothetical protein